MKADVVKKNLLVLAAVLFSAFALFYYGMYFLAAATVAAFIAMLGGVRASLIAILPAALSCIVRGGFSLTFDSCLVAIFDVCAVITGILLRRKAPYRVIATISAALCTLALGSVIVISAKIVDKSIVDLILDYGGVSEYADLVSPEQMTAICYAVIALSGVTAGGFVLVGSKVLISMLAPMLKKQNFKIPEFRKMALLPFWMLSKDFSIALLVTAISIIAVFAVGADFALDFAYVMAAIVSVPLCVQGISFAAFLLMTTITGTPGKALLIFLLLAITFPVGAVVFGLVEQFMRIRSRVVIIKRTDVDGADRPPENDAKDNSGDKKQSDESRGDDDNDDKNEKE